MSGAAIQISRGALMGLSAGAGSLYLYTNGAMPSGLTATDFGKIALGLTGGSKGTPPPQPQVPDYLLPLTQQLGDLSSEVARLRIQNQYAGQGYFYSTNGGWGLSWTTITTVGGVGILYLYIRGYSFGDFMYVTKKALSVAVDALENSIETVGIALETAKRELSYKLGIIEEKVEDTRVALEAKITAEVGDVKRDIEVVGSDVKGISRAQERVHGMVQSIETQIDGIEKKMANANEQLSTANRGIYLLCNVVADSMGGAAKGGPQRSNGQALYEELMAFTRSAADSFSRATGSFSRAPERQDSAPAKLMPSTDDGLRLLSNGSFISQSGSSRSLLEDMIAFPGGSSRPSNQDA